jgi:predicted  nucleic acid-binding Zn-ribbon protein
MKRKFINGLLLLALFVGFTGSVVSCKDYDDEKLGNLDGRVADLENDLRAKIADLQTQLSNCQQTCKDFRDATNEKFKLYVTIESLNSTLTNYYTKGETYNRQEILDLFNTKLADYYTQGQIDDMLKNLNLSQYATKTELEVLQNTLQGKIDELGEELKKYATIEALNTTQADLLANDAANLQLAYDSIARAKAELITYADQAAQAKYDAAVLYVDGKLVQVNADIEAAMNKAVEAYNLASQANTAAGNAQTTADAAKSLAETNKANLETLSSEFNSFKDEVTTSISTINGTISEIQETVAEVSALALANFILIGNMQEALDVLSEDLDEAVARIEGLESEDLVLHSMIEETNQTISGLQDEVAANKAEADRLHAEMLETISGLAEAIAENAANIEEVKQDVVTKVADLQGQINEANEAIQANTDAINALTGAFKNVAAKWITGIELNGSYNPMFGELNLPIDIRSNMLISFHGTLGNDGIEFPTRNQVYYQQETEQWKKFTKEDVDMLGGITPIEMAGNKTIINLNDEGTEVGNAGTLYMTINPTDRDFTGTEFKLIDSNDKESPVKIEPLKKSNHTLWFGYTRSGVEGAQSSNGFYEAKVTYSEAALQSNNRLRLDIEKLKDVVEDLKDYKNGFDLHNLTEAVYFNINQFLIANAVKATWTDELGTKSVVSQYGIGATSIKPLSFSWGKDLGEMTFGLGMAEDFIDRLIDKAAAGFPELRFIDYTIDDIAFEKFEDLDGDGQIDPNNIVATFNLKVTSLYLWEQGYKEVWVNVPTWHAYDTNGKIHTIHPADVRVKISIEPVEGYAGQVNVCISYDITEELRRLANYDHDKDNADEMERIRQQIDMYLDDIRDFLNDLKDIKPSKIADKAKSAISDYFDEIYKRYKRYLNPNKYVQPTLLVKSEDGYRRLSRSVNVPAQIKGTSLLLAPTTYTAEIISPAYKKFVAVTNVFKGEASAQGGDAACKSVLDKANAQSRINEVINGGWGSYIDFEAEDGYTYEVLYSAVDYTGLVFTEKYYFTVSK